MAGQDPKYQKVILWVRSKIADGTFREGDRLPSEPQLGEMFGLSRQTIRHATGELERQNLVTRVRGSGTYIKGGAGAELPPKQGENTAPRPRGERTRNIAVISTFYESYIFPQTIKGIERVLSHNGYTMQVSFTDNRIRREQTILQLLLEKDGIDGLIVEPAKSALPNPNLPYYREIMERGIPVLFFNAFYPQLGAPCVRIDDSGTACKAVDILAQAGHREIAGIFKADDGQGPLRYQGFLRGISKHGLKVGQERVVWIDTPMCACLNDIGEYILRRIEGCSGVVCYNDQVGYQLVEIALAHGIKVPEQLSVVGIDDDTNLAGVSRVPLTTFPHPKELLGKKVAENMLAMVENPQFDGNWLFETEAVLRDSVQRLQE